MYIFPINQIPLASLAVHFSRHLQNEKIEKRLALQHAVALQLQQWRFSRFKYL